MEIKKMKQYLRKIIPIKSFEDILNEDPTFKKGKDSIDRELGKRPYRYELINFLLEKFEGEKKYLEIGVRNPSDNFNKINCSNKISVDPGIEFKENPVDYKLTSDEFFSKISEESILSTDIKFDVIFIDGLHLAEQVYRDILNALNHLSEDGFIVLHDCNPPTEYHAREEHNFRLSPARSIWNGTVWKAFYKMRMNTEVSTACIDSDWGIGIVTKRKIASPLLKDINPFFEYSVFNENRKDSLNLMSFETFKSLIK